VRAALITALLRGLVHEQMQFADRPGMLLEQINRSVLTLLGQTGDLVFVTALYVVVDAASGEIRLASAGHPAPIHLRRQAGAAVLLSNSEGTGPALGLLADAVYEESVATLHAGDALLLFTDGLFEVANVQGEEFGRNRLRAALEARLALPTPLMIDEVLATIRSFQTTGAKGFEDDVCLVAVDRVR
jgi:sigma-B regulation protein RsbU (phosphoserine phosphatase)